jgi:hypothetical protein
VQVDARSWRSCAPYLESANAALSDHAKNGVDKREREKQRLLLALRILMERPPLEPSHDEVLHAVLGVDIKAAGSSAANVTGRALGQVRLVGVAADAMLTHAKASLSPAALHAFLEAWLAGNVGDHLVLAALSVDPTIAETHPRVIANATRAALSASPTGLHSPRCSRRRQQHSRAQPSRARREE